MPETAASRTGSAAPPTSGRGRRTCARSPSAPRSRSTESAGTRARRAASCSATSASSSAGRGVRGRPARRRTARARRRHRRRTARVGPHARAHRSRLGEQVSVRADDEGASSVKVKLTRKVLYELDGGDRTKVKAFKVKVEPAPSPSACPIGEADRNRCTIHGQLERSAPPEQPAAASSSHAAFECSRAPASWRGD